MLVKVRHLWLSLVLGCLLPVVLPSVTLADALSARGTTEAWQAAVLALSVSGRVEALRVQEGDWVPAGEPLVELERRAEELEVERRRLLLADRTGIQALEARRQVLREQVAQARALLTTGGMARKLVQDEQLALQAVEAELATLQATKAREAVELEQARHALDARVLRAPFDGIVTRRHLQVGESAPAYEPILELVDTSRIRFIGAYPPSVMVEPAVGDTVELDFGERHPQIAARVTFVSPVLDPASGLVEVIAEFDNPAGSPVRPRTSGRMYWGSAR